MSGAETHGNGANFAFAASDDRFTTWPCERQQRARTGHKKGVSRQDPRPDPQQRMNDEKLTFAGTLTDRRDE